MSYPGYDRSVGNLGRYEGGRGFLPQGGNVHGSDHSRDSVLPLSGGMRLHRPDPSALRPGDDLHRLANVVGDHWQLRDLQARNKHLVTFHGRPHAEAVRDLSVGDSLGRVDNGIPAPRLRWDPPPFRTEKCAPLNLVRTAATAIKVSPPGRFGCAVAAPCVRVFPLLQNKHKKG